MFRTLPVLFVFSVFATMLTAAADDSISLRYKFNKGDVHTYKLTDFFAQEIMGNKLENTQTRYITFEALSVAEDKVTFKATITRIHVKMASIRAGQEAKAEQEYDTDKDKEGKDPNQGFWRAMLNKSFTVISDTRGHILSVKGYNVIGEAVIASLSNQGARQPQAMEKQLLGMLFNDRIMIKQLDHYGIALPEDAVAEGKPWEEKTAVPFPLSPPFADLKVTKQNTLESMEQGLARISLSGTAELKVITLAEGDETTAWAEAVKNIKQLKVSASKVTGSVAFDAEKGLVKKSEQNMTLTIEMMGPGGMSQKLPLVTRQSMELVKFESAE